MRSTILAVAGWLACGMAWAGIGSLPAGAVLIDATTPKPAAAALAIDAGEILALAQANRAEAAFARLSAIDDPLRFELTAARVIERLQVQPGQGGPELLDRIAEVPVRVFMRQPETAAEWFVPVFDLPAKAASAQRMLVRAARRAHWIEALRSDPKSVVAYAKRRPPAAEKTSPPPTQPAAYFAHGEDESDPIASAQIATLAEAIRQAPPALVARLAEEIAAQKDALESPVQAALAARSADPRMWELALRDGEPVDVLPLFALAGSALGEAEARAWLRQAAAYPVYASTAAMAAMQLGGGDPMAALDSAERGAEAAAALARRPDAIELAERGLAEPAAAPTRLANLVLLLRLVDNEAARARLRALREDPRLPDAVRAELQR
jgi:hypothetical protein